MRIPLIAGNWKMHGSQHTANTLIQGIKTGAKAFSDIEILVIPPFVYLGEVHQLLSHTALKLGAQNLYLGDQGAYTGEISGPMLSDMGCHYVLIGHSERRSLFHEDLSLVAAKFKAAVAADLMPILCVGETE